MTKRGLGRLAAMLIAAAAYCAVPAVAFAQGGGSDDDVSGGGNQVIGGDQDANTGDNDAVGGGSDGGGGGLLNGNGGGRGGGGGDAGSENNTGNAINQQQNAQNNCTIVGNRNECNQSITQNQTVGGGVSIDRGGGRHGHAHVSRVLSVRSVGLAQTGFDAWILALLGGVSLAGGLGLLAAQRRGKLPDRSR